MQIDFWTLGLQALNFLILVWVLHRFLYRPVLNVIVRRQAAVNEALAEAEGKRSSAEALARDSTERLSRIEEERQSILRHQQARIQEEREKILRDAQVKAEAESVASHTQLERELQRIENELADRMINMGVDLASRLVGDIDDMAVTEAFFQRLLEHLDGIGPDRLKVLRDEIGADQFLEIATPLPLDKTATKRWKKDLTAYLGHHFKARFMVDERLLAGVELRFPHSRIGFSWRDAIAAARQELAEP